jgi:hypothetical protein
MIVKKIATAQKAPPKSKAANVRALADYIATPGAGGDGEKVEHRGALNLLNLDHDGQVQEMIDLAETAKRSPQPVQHWILSWRENEQPTVAQADEAVRMFLAEMGLTEHQAIYALHRDTELWHVHIAVNRVNPETEKLVTVNKGFDHEIAHRAIARIERHQGWQRLENALYLAGPDGSIERTRARGEGERQPSARARDFEERAGERSVERVALDEAAPIIRGARDWRALHAGLAARGMRYERKGSGALLWVGERPVKASVAGRDCSRAALERRLGEFVPGPTTAPGRPRAPDPLDRESPTLRAYVDARHKHYEERSAQRARAGDQQREEARRMLDRHRQERADIFRGSWKGRGALLNATRSVLAARQAQEKAALQERQKLERAMPRQEKGRFPSYEEWLGTSRTVADQWRHRERRRPSIEGETFVQPAPRDIRAFRATVDGWRVHYRMTGGRGGPAFTDHGKAIDIHDSARRESVLAALQLSAQKWGTFTIQGGESFRRTCVELAAEHGFKIANPELQHAVAEERARRQPARSRGPSTDDERRPPSEPTGLGGIYRRHLAQIAREQPERIADASRLDAEIAVRMSITGHSRWQVVEAIKLGARAGRPNEKRDWDLYAARAANWASSPAAEHMGGQLKSQERWLVRLEGREGEVELLRRLGGPMRDL